MAADEIVLATSSIEVVPVVRAGHRRRIGNGKPGPVALEPQGRYRAEVARRLGNKAEEQGD